MKAYADDTSDGSFEKKERISLHRSSAKNLLQKKKLRKSLETAAAELKEDNRSDSGSKTIQRKKPEKSAFLTNKGNFVGGGSNLVLNALAAYLRYLEGTARDEWQE